MSAAPKPRPLAEVILQIRMACANPAVSTTLVQTQDLLNLCDATERIAELEKALEGEREACAKIAEKHTESDIFKDVAIAREIRARAALEKS